MPGEAQLYRTLGRHIVACNAGPPVLKRALSGLQVPLLMKWSKMLKLPPTPDPNNKYQYLFQMDYQDLRDWHALCLPRNVEPYADPTTHKSQVWYALQSVLDHVRSDRALALGNHLLGDTVNSKSPQDFILYSMAEILDETGVETISEANQIHDQLEDLAATQDAHDSVAIFPNEAAIVRLVGAMLLEQSDEWTLQRRYMQLEGLQSLSDTASPRLAAVQR